jgi:glycosyltransferase involved in cell wall biosynthesis
MAQGKIVLASDVGGHRELVMHERNGWLFPAGDPTALTRAAVDLFAARHRWPALRVAGRRYVEDERNWPASVARYAEVYTRVAG